MAVKRVLCVLLLISICLTLVGCADREHIYCEIGITLPVSFREINADGEYDLAFKKGSSIIGIRRFSFEAAVEDGILATHSALKFAEIYRERLEVASITALREDGDIPYFTYTLNRDGKSYVYMPTFYRTPYAYFIVVFVCENGLFDGGRVEFLKICHTLRILPEYI